MRMQRPEARPRRGGEKKGKVILGLSAPTKTTREENQENARKAT
jgi:hypothetical protein